MLTSGESTGSAWDYSRAISNLGFYYIADYYIQEDALDKALEIAKVIQTKFTSWDEIGWVPIEQLLDALHKAVKWSDICEADLSKMIEKSEKKRHEIKDGKIRAFYGHSLPMKLLKEEKKPPNMLYHGTARRFFKSIMEHGLSPRSRQYVHLSQDLETAENVGKRHDDKPIILIIDAKKAWEAGIKFYCGNDKVWLADIIPEIYLKRQ